MDFYISGFKNIALGYYLVPSEFYTQGSNLNILKVKAAFKGLKFLFT